MTLIVGVAYGVLVTAALRRVFPPMRTYRPPRVPLSYRFLAAPILAVGTVLLLAVEAVFGPAPKGVIFVALAAIGVPMIFLAPKP